MKSVVKVNKLVLRDRQVTLGQCTEQTQLRELYDLDDCGAGCRSLERALCLEELRL